MKNELLIEDFLMTKKDLYIEDKYYSLYDTFLSESIDDEFKESIDLYSIEEEDCFMIDIDIMIQVALEYDLYNSLYDYDNIKTYSRYDLTDIVINDMIRIYKILLDTDILIRMIQNLNVIVESLHDMFECLNDYK